jgi:hypothetical protein
MKRQGAHLDQERGGKGNKDTLSFRPVAPPKDCKEAINFSRYEQ